MSALGDFLQNNGLTDPKIMNYMTKTLQLETVSDFASYWTRAEYEAGVKTDIVQQVADVSLPTSSSRLHACVQRGSWRRTSRWEQPQQRAPRPRKPLMERSSAWVGHRRRSRHLRGMDSGRPSFSRRVVRTSSGWTCLMSPW